MPEGFRHTTRIAVAILGIHVALLARGAAVHSPSFDEVGHLPAGISHWRRGRFDVYRVNPPLVRLAATLPAVLAGADIDWDAYAAQDGGRPEFELGRLFIQAHGADSLWYFRVGRWACLPFAVLGGWICYSWARRLYGDASGLAALMLWASSPDILAHAPMITPDAGASALGVAAGYLFWDWLGRPSPARALAAGAVLGLALLAKFTLLVLVAAWPALWLLRRLGDRGAWGATAGKAPGAQLGLILVVALNVVNLGYAFEDPFRPLGTFKFSSDRLSGLGRDPYDERYYGNRFAGTWLGALPVPVPAEYVRGIDTQLRDFEKPMDSYLGGRWRRKGWWYYYLYAALVKEPAGTLGLAALAMATMVVRPRRSDLAGELPLLLPAVAFFTLVSSETGFNHHFRYVLPALPYATIWISRVFAGPPRSTRIAGRLGAILLAWSVIASLWQVPHSLAYFNEFAGGPLAGPRHLHHSNLDWGQDLLFLKRWCDEHPDARPLHIVYSGSFNPEALKIWGPGIHVVRVPQGRPGDSSGPAPRWYALCVGRIFDPPEEPDEFARFRSRKPDAIAGSTIYLFRE